MVVKTSYDIMKYLTTALLGFCTKSVLNQIYPLIIIHLLFISNVFHP